MKRLLMYIFGAGITLFLLNYLYLQWTGSQSSPDQVDRVEIHRRLQVLKAEAQLQKEKEELVSRRVDELIRLSKLPPATTVRPLVHKDPRHVVEVQAGQVDVQNVEAGEVRPEKELVIPILLFACNRPPNDALSQIIKYRPDSTKFPIIVTQDCNDEAAKATSDAIDSFGDQIFKHIKQPNQSPIPNLNKKDKKFESYYKISRHYKWALGQIFDVMQYEAVVILEDDLMISPDFYDYFEAGHRLMLSDPSLFCVSAWNDNGKIKRIEDNPERLWRADFFPGLGWLLQKKIWDEVKADWPTGGTIDQNPVNISVLPSQELSNEIMAETRFWDDWFRQEGQRKERACIRPEISRVSMSPIGKKGASKGQFFDKHLKFIVGNTKPVQFTAESISYLHKDVYDLEFVNKVYGSPLVNLNELQLKADSGTLESVRIQYTTKQSYKLITKTLEIMDDFKEGVPRTAYRGIVPIMFNRLRVYIAPPADWKSYDKSWS